MKLIEILLDTYKEEYDLNLKEGLTKTTPVGQTVSILRKKFPKYVFLYSKGDTVFNVSISREEGALSEKDAREFMTLLNNLGWFPSFIEVYGRKMEVKDRFNERLFLGSIRSEKTYMISLRCEAKYDTLVDKHPKALYHLAPKKNSSKIEKIGLVPKSRSKASYHPDRVYLSKTEEDAERLAPSMYRKTGERDYVILRIDTDMIPGGYLKLYQDPNYFKRGYYTLNNIPPMAIEKVKDIKTQEG